MLKKIKAFIVVGIAGLTLSTPALVPLSVGAIADCASDINSSINNGINEATGGGDTCASTAQNGVNLSTIAAKVVNILSVVVGIVAVIMIIIGGFRYITSGGESGSVSGAKNTLIYAIVGLLIVALAQFIVHFVLNSATSSVSTS